MLEEIQNIKLRQPHETDAGEFYILTSETEILEFKDYIHSIIYDPSVIHTKVKNLLLMYIACIQFVVLSFESHQYLDDDLVSSCDSLAKTVYIFYNDLSTLLYTKRIEFLWKTYVKLCNTAKHIPTSSSYKVTASRGRILKELNTVSKRIRIF